MRGVQWRWCSENCPFPSIWYGSQRPFYLLAYFRYSLDSLSSYQMPLIFTCWLVRHFRIHTCVTRVGGAIQDLVVLLIWVPKPSAQYIFATKKGRTEVNIYYKMLVLEVNWEEITNKNFFLKLSLEVTRYLMVTPLFQLLNYCIATLFCICTILISGGGTFEPLEVILLWLLIVCGV